MGRPALLVDQSPSASEIAHYWQGVDRSAGPDACWPWIRSLSGSGYGAIKIAGVQTNAQRAAWLIANGPIPAGLYVLHRCDNRPCCNPAHLFLGTQRENVADMIAKGRAGRSHHGRGGARGEAHYNARLSDRDIELVRRAVAAGERHRTIAARFGISRQYVGMLAHGVRRSPRDGCQKRTEAE